MSKSWKRFLDALEERTGGEEIPEGELIVSGQEEEKTEES